MILDTVASAAMPTFVPESLGSAAFEQVEPKLAESAYAGSGVPAAEQRFVDIADFGFGFGYMHADLLVEAVEIRQVSANLQHQGHLLASSKATQQLADYPFAVAALGSWCYPYSDPTDYSSFCLRPLPCPCPSLNCSFEPLIYRHSL